MKQTGMRAINYINSLRNPKKKEYAKAYYDALLKGKANSFRFDNGLSFMAKQAVEINLNVIESSLTTRPLHLISNSWINDGIDNVYD